MNVGQRRKIKRIMAKTHKTREQIDAENVKIKQFTEEGRSAQYIASAIGVSETTVLKRISRGLEPKQSNIRSKQKELATASVLYGLDLAALDRELTGKVAKLAGPKHYDMLYQINLLKNITNSMLIKCKSIIDGTEEENVAIMSCGGAPKIMLDCLDKAADQLKVYVNIMSAGYGAQRQKDFEQFVIDFMGEQPESVRTEFGHKLRLLNERRASSG